MPGAIGHARSNDIVPNGPIVALPAISVPGTLNLATYATYGFASVLNCLCTGTFSISTVVLPTTQGVPHAAAVELYIPVNGQSVLYIQGSGTFSSNLYTSRTQE